MLISLSRKRNRTQFLNHFKYLTKKITIGRTDRAHFPELGFLDIDIKIDTGAYTSSIYCTDIGEEDGALTANFLDPEHPKYNGRKMYFEEYEITQVRSSNGQSQLRYEVKTIITLFKKHYVISLTLSDRKEMRYPVLIGRKFLSKKFVVDTELQDLSFILSQNEN
ncbi:hypothetical protein JCM19294_2471 [Nonlabens tegetincola]|uniref:Retropepsin-like aspartic endopeptidase domain-containing protein n=1 Tax=Nonlabens tegetincola TaxID=323273 RepID=A0A090PXW1_9FLAO|nr:hypothetical protein JCM19294_2471 [Nonlabens tegetincola]